MVPSKFAIPISVRVNCGKSAAPPDFPTPGRSLMFIPFGIVNKAAIFVLVGEEGQSLLVFPPNVLSKPRLRVTGLPPNSTLAKPVIHRRFVSPFFKNSPWAPKVRGLPPGMLPIATPA
jgi:hypothetical protein